MDVKKTIHNSIDDDSIHNSTQDCSFVQVHHNQYIV